VDELELDGIGKRFGDVGSREMIRNRTPETNTAPRATCQAHPMPSTTP